MVLAAPRSTRMQVVAGCQGTVAWLASRMDRAALERARLTLASIQGRREQLVTPLRPALGASGALVVLVVPRGLAAPRAWQALGALPVRRAPQWTRGLRPGRAARWTLWAVEISVCANCVI